MDTTCQRCHETLRDADRYCPVCGLPQLRYVAEELPVRALGDDSEEEGTAQADAGRDSGRGIDKAGIALTGGIAWRPALQAALIVGIPAGVLSSELTPIGSALSLFWMVTAAAWAVSLYGKRARLGRLTMRVGARIGLLTGVLASWLTLSVNGAYLWVERFVLHQGSQMDALWLAQVQAGMQLNQQMISQMGMASAQSTEFSKAWQAMMMSAEGRAGLELWGLLAGSAFLILFSMIGGAVGARFLVQRGRTSS